MPRTVVQVPSGGLDLVTPAGYGRRDSASQLFNVLPGTPGALPLRGPFSSKQAVSASTIQSVIPNDNTNSFAIWRADNSIQVVQASTSGLTLSAPATAFAASGVLGLTTNFWFVTSTQYQGNTYAPTNGLTSPIVRWTGNTTSASFSTLAHAPVGAQAVCAHLGRMFVLSGNKPDTTNTWSATALYWSDAGWDGVSDVADRWQDDVSGLTNLLELGGTGDAPKTMVSWQDRLYFFRRGSIQALIGSAPSNWQLKTVANIGTTDVHTIEVTDEGIFFRSDSGLVVFDGVQVRPISTDIPMMFADTLTPVVELPNSYLAVLADKFNVGGFTPRQFLFHRATGTWSEIDASTSGETFTGYSSTPYTVVAISSTRLTRIDCVGRPESAKNLSGGTPGLDFGTTPIVGTAATRPILLADPFERALVKRMFGRARVSAASGTPTWSVALLDETGATRATLTQNGSATDVPLTQVQELYLDPVAAVQVKWTINANSAQPEVAEVHDAYLEWESSYQRTA